jgi:hypothetical protein
MAIVSDPVLLVVFRKAGADPAWQAAITEVMMAGSVKRAMGFTLAAGGASVRLLDILEGVDEAMIRGVLACIAYKLHALPSSSVVRDVATPIYTRLAGEHGFDPARPNDEPRMPLDARRELARAILDLVAEKKRGTYEKAIPGLSFD